MSGISMQFLALQIGIQAQWDHNDAPCLTLIGRSATGKTACIDAVASAFEGKHFAPFSIAQNPPELLAGFPFADLEKGVMMRLPDSELWKIVEAGPGNGIIFYDEAPDADDNSQAGVQEGIQNGRFGSLRLPERTAMVAAGNPPDISTTGGSLSIPMAKRMCQIPWVADFDSWTAAARDGWGTPEIVKLPKDWQKLIPIWRDHVIAFLDAKRDCFDQDAPANGVVGDMVVGKAAPAASPRTWHYAWILMAATSSLEGLVSDELVRGTRLMLLSGCVGAPTATMFTNWLRKQDLPAASDILNDPRTAPIPREGDKIRTVCHSVATAVIENNTQKRYSAAWIYLGRVADSGLESMAVAASVRLTKNIPPGGIPKEATVVVQKFLKILGEAGLLNT